MKVAFAEAIPLMIKDGKTVPVPVHETMDLGKGLLADIERQTGVNIEMKLHYPALFEPQEASGFFVQFVDLENAVTAGETVEECLFNAEEVLTLILEDRLERGEEIPAPSEGVAGAHYIAPSPSVQAAMLLRDARGQRQLSDLARAMETSWAAAHRLEDPRHWPTLKQLDKAARVLGKRLVLAME